MLKPMRTTFTFLEWRHAAEQAEARRKRKEIVFLALAIVVTIVLAVIALAGCGPSSGQNASAQFPETQRAIAAASIDYAVCLEQGATPIATPQGFTKDAVFALAETCGIRAIPDGVAILVAFYRDMKAKITAHNAAAIASESGASAPPKEATP